MMDIDLNLLRIFDILYDERNVTRAAARLFLTQSAVSHALAHELAPRLRMALAEIRSAVATPMFDPAKTRQRFVIAAGSYFCMLIVPSLIALARKSALFKIHASPLYVEGVETQRNGRGTKGL
jgi:DNA-binding transcriptional LysR family regulator